MFNRLNLPTCVPIPLRLIVGVGFIEHGYAKLLKGPEAFAAILHALNVPAPHLMAWLTIQTELLGGFAVLLGAFVPLFSMPMAAVLLVAMFRVHWQYGFSSIKLMAVTPEGPKFGPPGYEGDLLYLACLVALVLGGPGPLSVSTLLSRRAKWRDGWRARIPSVSDIGHRFVTPIRTPPARCCNLEFSGKSTWIGQHLHDSEVPIWPIDCTEE
jgi:putative oxidoreductase